MVGEKREGRSRSGQKNKAQQGVVIKRKADKGTAGSAHSRVSAQQGKFAEKVQQHDQPDWKHSLCPYFSLRLPSGSYGQSNYQCECIVRCCREIMAR